MKDQELLEIGLQKRQGKLQESWNLLAEIYGKGKFTDGEQFRKWTRTKAINKNNKEITAISIQPVNSKKLEEIIINPDGSQVSDKVIELNIEDEKLIHSTSHLLEYHGFNPKEWKLVSARSSKWQAQTSDEEQPIKVLYSSRITAKPYSTELTEEKSYELEMAEIELKKAKYQVQEQRNEYNKLIRQQAKFDNIKELLDHNLKKIAETKPLVFNPRATSSKIVRGNAIWSDWHVGSDFTNTLNHYSIPEFRRRLSNLIERSIVEIQTHGITHLTIGALGDFLSGSIHISTRVQASEDVISQLTIVSEALAESVAELSKYVDEISFINIFGNHARLISEKQAALLNENLERIIPWYLETRLKDFTNVKISHGSDGYYIDHTFEEPHMYCHGDLDRIGQVAKTASQGFGVIPRLIFSGHIHHQTLKEFGKTIVISNSSLIGVDDYAVGGRFFSEPMQLMHIFDVKGRVKYSIPIYVKDGE